MTFMRFFFYFPVEYKHFSLLEDMIFIAYLCYVHYSKGGVGHEVMPLPSNRCKSVSQLKREHQKDGRTP